MGLHEDAQRAQAGLSLGWDIRAGTQIQAGGAIRILRRGLGRQIQATHRAPVFVAEHTPRRRAATLC
jgi:hypothetical protein